MPKTLLVILMSLLLADALNLVVGPTQQTSAVAGAVAAAPSPPSSTRPN
jgi:hypothetical protein